MKKIVLLITGAFISLIVFSQRQERHEITIPDIAGYHTLKCDFHMHTVFSDGAVWPTVRVEEAWLDGLDAIAITDHVEYLPHKEITVNRNSSYDIAKGKANQMNLILIRGAEVTRSYPCGHCNCLFTSDNELLNKKDSMEAFAEATKQSAIIQWNHPGWMKPNRIPEWTEVQTTLVNKKMMNMIEIVNGVDNNSYYPLAHQWALDKNLAISANSDAHDPLSMNYGNKIHRPVTLVFAKERSESGIKAAILDGRTAVYYFDTLIGKEEYLKPIFKQSLIVKTPVITIKGKLWIDVILENISDVPLMISFKGGSDEYAELGSGVYIPAHGSGRVLVKGKKEDYSGERTYAVPCVIDNYYIGPRKGMNAQFEFKVKFEKK